MAETQLPPYTHPISSLSFSPSSPTLLLSTSWDTNLTLHDLTRPSTAALKVPGKGALLDGCWGTTGKAFVGGLAREVREIELEGGKTRVLGRAGDAIKSVCWSEDHNVLLAGSWDRTLSIYSPSSSSSSALSSISLPGKVYSMAVSNEKVVVAMSGRGVWIWDLRNLSQAVGAEGSSLEPEQKRESSLKFMTRKVATMPGGEGYTTTSIEGRVSVEFFDPTPAAQAKKYAFKCHRAVVDGVDTVYPVNGLAFNPVHGTFATGGSDSTVSLWDPAAKKRLRQFPKYPSPVSALAFNCDGSKLAVGFSEDDLFGGGGSGTSAGNGNGVIVREVGEEGKGKGGKKD